MFGTVKAPPVAIDVDTIALIEGMVWAAKYHRKQAKMWKSRETMPDENGFKWSFSYANNAHHDEMAQASASVWSLRWAISQRTLLEWRQAEATVRLGHAAFWSGSCAGETCMDCELPMWHHIIMTRGPALCPFGREFWVLARAIDQRARSYGYDDSVVNLKEIARRA